MIFDGKRLNDMESSTMRAMRREMQITFQDHSGSLNQCKITRDHL